MVTTTARTIGPAGIVIIATIIVTPIITGDSLTGIATPGWLEVISSQPNFLERKFAEEIQLHQTRRVYLPHFGEAAGLVTGLLPGSSIWNSFLNC